MAPIASIDFLFACLAVATISAAAADPASTARHLPYLPQFAPCPNGWLQIGDNSSFDCVTFASNFSGNFTQAEAHCRSLGSSLAPAGGNADSSGFFHLAVVRDAVFERLLATAAPPDNHDNGTTYWLFDARSSSNPGAAFYAEFRPSPADGLVIKRDDTTAGAATTARAALCARQAPAAPILPVTAATPLDDARCPPTAKWYHAGACYRLTSGSNFTEAAAACAQWTAGAAPAALTDWSGHQLAVVLADRLPDDSSKLLVVGLNRLSASVGTAGYWHWQGRPRALVRLTVWTAGHPDALDDCAAVSGTTGLWLSRPCQLPVPAMLCQAPAVSAGAATTSVSTTSAAELSIISNDSGKCRSGFAHHDGACYRLADTCNGGGGGSSSSGGVHGRLWVTRPSELAFAALLAATATSVSAAGGTKNGSHFALAWPVPFEGAAWESPKLPPQLPPPTGRCLSLEAGTGALSLNVACDVLAATTAACRYDLTESEGASGGSGGGGGSSSTAAAAAPPACPRGWTSDNDRRCLATTAKTGAVAWPDAESACRALGVGVGINASLASLHADLPAPVAKALLGKAGDDDGGGVWIGLRVNRFGGLGGGYGGGGGLLRPAWTDATPFDFLPPGVEEASATSLLRCGYVGPGSGVAAAASWRLSSDCGPTGKRRPALCQLLMLPTTSTPTTSTSAPTTTASTTTTATPKSFAEACLDSSTAAGRRRLSRDGNRCYGYALLTGRSMSWSEASAACRAAPINGTLASIQSDEENQLVSGLAAASSDLDGGGLAWLGLNEAVGRVPDQLTAWEDGSPLQFVNFASSSADADSAAAADAVDADATAGQCVAMMMPSHPTKKTARKPPSGSGVWHVRRCSRRLGAAVCKSVIASRHSSAGGGGASTASPSSKLPTATVCPDGWDAAPGGAGACYRLLAKPLTYSKARKACQGVGGDLASYQTSGQHEFLTSRLAATGKRSGLAWIGLHWLNAKGGYHWLDGSQLKFLDWPLGAAAVSDSHCLALAYHPLMARSGYQLATPCHLPLPALCRFPASVLPSGGAGGSSHKSPKAKAAASSCSVSGYVAFNGSCYRFGEVKANYETARAACEADGARLLWLESSFEVHFLRSVASSLSNPPPLEVWLGLRAHTNSVASFPTSWSSSGRPLRFDYLLPASRHYAVDRLAGCYAYRLYNRATPTARGLARIPGGLADDCGASNKHYVCKMAASASATAPARGGAAPSPASATTECYHPERPYRGFVNRAGAGAPCLRWDLVRALYEQRDARNFRNVSRDVRAAINLLTAFGGHDGALTDAADNDMDGKETLGEAASYCRQLRHNSLPAELQRRPSCFVATAAGRRDAGPASIVAGLEFCHVPLCSGVQGDGDSGGESNRRSGSASVGLLSGIVIVCACAVAAVGVLGFCLWKRGRWAAGYRPQLNLDAGGGGGGIGGDAGLVGGGTSFHNPIYMPANC